MMKTKLIYLLLALCLPQIAYLQISIGGTPYSSQNSQLKSSDKIPQEATAAIDLNRIQQEDAFNDTDSNIPTRFGIEQAVNYKLNNTGLWEKLPNGDRLWRLKIQAPEALSINLVYNDFYLPEGGKLFLYNEEKTQILGAFTNLNNKVDGVFGTALVYGDVTILEYYEPAKVEGKGRISINTVVHGYRYISKDNASLGNSGSCNVDAICPDGNNWRDEIKAVAKIVIGGGLCSGSLLGNTNRDCTPYFLTANHCGFGSSTIFYWHFERPNCGSGTPDDTKTTAGARALSSSLGSGVIQSDFNLWLLDESPVDAGYGVYFLGWDAREIAPASVVGIHHPAGDAKKISVANTASTSTVYYGNTTNASATHWRIAAWDNGTTEGGSSGSPLFDQTTKRVVGKLSGGDAACNGTTGNDNDEPDWYGKISYSWLNDGALPTHRLKDWLDLAKTDELFIDGYLPTACAVPTCSDGIQNQDETGIDCGGATCPTCPCSEDVTLSITFDDYPEETAWILQNSSGAIVARGGTYNGQAQASTLTEALCLVEDCYTLTVSDFANDGICCAYGNGSYTLTVDSDNRVLASGNFTGSLESNTFCIESIALDLKVMLKGSHDSGTSSMRTDLGSALIPMVSPYGDGASTSSTAISTNNIVDWVKVEIRNPSAPHAIVAFRGALLKATGEVVDVDGTSVVRFPNASFPSIVRGNNYRVAVRHRNHLGVMSAMDYVLD